MMRPSGCGGASSWRLVRWSPGTLPACSASGTSAQRSSTSMLHQRARGLGGGVRQHRARCPEGPPPHHDRPRGREARAERHDLRPNLRRGAEGLHALQAPAPAAGCGTRVQVRIHAEAPSPWPFPRRPSPLTPPSSTAWPSAKCSARGKTVGTPTRGTVQRRQHQGPPLEEMPSRVEATGRGRPHLALAGDRQHRGLPPQDAL